MKLSKKKKLIFLFLIFQNFETFFLGLSEGKSLKMNIDGFKQFFKDNQTNVLYLLDTQFQTEYQPGNRFFIFIFLFIFT